MYTYFYGVLCERRSQFICLNQYDTNHERGIVNVTLGVAIRCEKCTEVCVYDRGDVVYSKSRDDYVPLNT